MRFGYQFSNLCGTVYRDGNTLFTPDGNSLISPVGNRLTVFDLVNNKSATLPCENNKNINRIALSPDGRLLLSIDVDGRAILINYTQGIILNHFSFKSKVYDIKFSPDGAFFALTVGKLLQVWRTPGLHKEFAPFVLHRTYAGHYDDITCLDWSPDGRFIVTGSKDMSCRIFSLDPIPEYKVLTLTGHRDYVRGVFFSADAEYIYTVSKDGAMFLWKNIVDLKTYHSIGSSKSDLIDGSSYGWHLEKKHFFEKNHARVISCAFHKKLALMVIGFSSGIFSIFEMPDINEIHSLTISQKRISSVSINNTGEWLAFGCARMGQLLVWEWKSETYVMKQQGHFYDMNILDYSPDGQYIATGGDDSKVKIWNTRSGFCFVTFKEHNGGITGIQFSSKSNAVFSCSLDGTVRAFDLHRYRNFRTFTSPNPVQFSCLAVDMSGDIICAGTRDTFEIYVWSVQTGRLLDILTGHEGPITCLAFSPAAAVLYSGSWDHSVRVWDVFENKNANPEILVHKTDVRALCVRPDGSQMTVATLDGDLTFWDLGDNRQTGFIPCRRDLGAGRKVDDLISAKNNVSGKCFTSLCYSADGKCVLAGGRSKFVCIYEIEQKVMLKRFCISNNQSLDGLNDKLNSKFMTANGSTQAIDHDEDSDAEGRRDMFLPGVAKGDMSKRRVKPEIRVKSVKFSSTGRAWAACSTEGLMIYSLDERIAFDPYDLDVDVTPVKILTLLANEEYAKSLCTAFRLNEKPLIDRVVENVPVYHIPTVVKSLHVTYVIKLLYHVAHKLENTIHVEFYLTWCFNVFSFHGQYLKQNSSDIITALRTLQKNITSYQDSLSKLCDENKYTMQYITTMAALEPPIEQSSNDKMQEG